MKNLAIILLTLGFITVFRPVLAEDVADGTYDATVRTDSGSYNVPVEVDNGEVTHVEWPNGGNMRVRGAELDGNAASGYNSDGDRIDIEIDN